MLALKDVNKYYGRNHVLKDISLDFHAGESLVLVGESGSGKTTIAKIIAGMEKADHGSVLFAGRSLAGNCRQRRFEDCAHIQYIFQDPYSVLEPAFTVERVFAETGRICRRNRWQFITGTEALSYVDANLLPYLQRPIGELSGGQRQKICIARALIPIPKVIIADESTSMLDYESSIDIFNLLNRIKEEKGIILITILHDIDLSYDRWDKIAVLESGALVEQMPFSDFYSKAKHPYSRELIEAYKFFQEDIVDAEDTTTGRQCKSGIALTGPYIGG